MKFRDRLKLAISPQNGIFEVLQKYASAYLSGDDVPSSSNSAIKGEYALAYSAVFACNRVLAETLASCPIFEYEKRKDGNRTSITDSTEYDILHNAPNPDMTPVQFKEMGVSNINMGGNFVAQKIRNARKDLIQLRPLPYTRVQITIDKSGGLFYIVDGKYDSPLTREDVLHIPGLCLDNGYIGITPIEYAQTSLNVGVSQEEFQRNFYRNGVSVSGVFEHPDALGDDAFSRLKKDISKNYQGLKNAGVPMILEGGMKFKEVSMKLSDAQFIESKRFQIEDIARMFRVPLHLIGDLTRSTNNNIEHQSLEFIIYTMLPWFKRWEENLNLQLLSREQRMAGRYFEFKIDSLLRGDITSRYTAYATARQWGWLSVNDILRLENMNGLGPEGDIYLQPMNMVKAGTEPEPANTKMADEIYKLLKGGEKRE